MADANVVDMLKQLLSNVSEIRSDQQATKKELEAFKVETIGQFRQLEGVLV
jgi:hypothetical protein